jgi:hypothetical protein
LVVFVMMLFVLLGLAALVIELGFARLAQRQMQTAVDSAALEVSRLQDVPTLTEKERRLAAVGMAASVFDDDFDLADDPMNFGAGPVVEFSDGIPLPGTSFRAAETMTPGAPPVYDPDLRSNLVNDKGGDIVRGDYPDGVGISHEEQDDYTRDDFTPNLAGNAYLVRMRRTDESFDPASESSSGGPPIPYLFARGTALDRDTAAQGIDVRATGISDARPVLSVGFADNSLSPPLSGLATNTSMAFSFALELSYWNDLPASNSQTLSGGAIGAVGRFFHRTDSTSDMPVVVGRSLPAAASPVDSAYTGYVPIYTTIPNGTASTSRIVGYGLGTAVVTKPTVTITRQPTQVASENASASILYSTGLASAELSTVLGETGRVAEPLLAPVSVR